MTRKPWWNKKWGKDCVCSITYKRLRPGKNSTGQSKVIFLDCNHGFYRDALNTWKNQCLPNKPTCPVCRKEFDLLPQSPPSPRTNYLINRIVRYHISNMANEEAKEACFSPFL